METEGWRPRDGQESGEAERPGSRSPFLKSPKAANRSVMSSPGRSSVANGMGSPMRAAKRKSIAAIEQRMLGPEYRVFPLSKYQGDGWEPFLPKNPLEGTPFEGIAVDFEARRRRLDVVRNKSLLRGDEDDDWKRIASKRTARRLAKEGIAADSTGMGLFSKGVVLVDDNDEQYLEPSWYEPTQDQIKKFLRAEAKRVWTQDGRLDALVQRILKEMKKKEDEEEDEGYEQFEEDDYQTALRVLAKLQSRPRILCCAVTLTGSGSANFVTTDKRVRNRSWVVFRRAMAESLGLTEIEIAIVSATTTTVGTLSESVDVDFRICTPHAELAEVLAELIEECVEDGSLGRSLTMFNLQSLTSIRKGPAIFQFPGGYDSTQRLFGEQAVELRQQIAAWEYELMKKKQKPQKRIETTLDVYQDDEVVNVQAPDTPTQGWSHTRKKKRFKLTDGDTLEQQDAAPPSPRPPHGFVLQPRPQSSLDRIQAYAPLQSSHSMDTVPRPKSEIGIHREARESACDRRGVGVQPQEAVAPNEKLAEYFKSRASKKATPQRGDVTFKTKEYRNLCDATKAENLRKIQEDKEQRAQHRHAVISRSRSVGVAGWGDDSKSVDEVKSIAAVLPSIDNSLQNARFKAQARATPANQTRIQASTTTDVSKNTPKYATPAAEKTGLAALSLSKEVVDAVQKSELSLEEVMECTEQELMQLTGLGQLECFRLKKKLVAQEEHRKNQPDVLRERARLAAEQRKRLQNVGPTLNTGSRGASKGHEAYEQLRLKERGAQMEEERRNRAKEVERDRQRFRSLKSNIDTGSKILPPRSVSAERSGLSAFSEQSDDHGPGWTDQFLAEPSEEGATRHEQGGKNPPTQSSARRDVHVPRPGALDQAHRQEDAFKGASRRNLLVEGTGSGKKSSFKDKAKTPTVATSREKSDEREMAAAPWSSLEGANSLSAHSLATPSEKGSFHSSRSPSVHSFGRSLSRGRLSSNTAADIDTEEAAHGLEGSVRHGGVSPFPEGVLEEPSEETLMLASLSALQAVDSSSGPLLASSSTTKSTAHKGKHHSLRRRSSSSHVPNPPPAPRRRKSVESSSLSTDSSKVKLTGQWSSLLDDVTPKSSKAKPTMRKGSKVVKKRTKRRISNASSEDDRDSVASFDSITSQPGEVGPCLCCKGTKKLVLDDLPEYLQEILPAIGKTWVACPLCCSITHIEINRPPTAKKTLSLKPWKAAQHCPEVGKGLVVFDRADSEDGGSEKKKRAVAGIAMDVKAVSAVVVFSNGDLEEYELATGALVHTVTVPVAGEIYSVCKHNGQLYLGMDSCIQEVTLPPNATPGKTLKGQDGHILCLAALSDEESILVSGSRNQTTFIWDLDAGTVMYHTINLKKDLPTNLRPFAEGLPAHRQAFAFRHHSGPVSCCAATKGVFITGGWDGLLCVVFYTAYEDRWRDEQIAALMRDRKDDLKKRNQQLKDEISQFKSSKALKQQRAKLEVELNSNEDSMLIIGNALVSAEARLKIASQRCRKFLFEPNRDVGRVTSLAFTTLENKTYGLFAGYSDGKVRQWDVQAGTVVHLFMTWVPLSVTSVCLGIGRVYCGYANGLIKVWNLTSLNERTIRTQKNAVDLVGHQDGVAFLRLCDNLLFSCAEDKSMRTWDLRICDPEMALPQKTAQPASVQRTPSELKYARLEEVEGAFMRVISIPEPINSVAPEVSQPEEEPSSSEEEEVQVEPESPLELQELSASLPFDPSVYSENKAEQNELLSELLEIGQAVENLGDSLVHNTIKARTYILRHPAKQAKGVNS